MKKQTQRIPDSDIARLDNDFNEVVVTFKDNVSLPQQIRIPSKHKRNNNNWHMYSVEHDKSLPYWLIAFMLNHIVYSNWFENADVMTELLLSEDEPIAERAQIVEAVAVETVEELGALLFDDTPPVIEPVEETQEPVQVAATNSAKKLATDNGIDISLVEGTGRDGKVIKSDVQNYLDSIGG